MARSIIDIHIIQSVPPSNINRDDTGSPKTAVYGGVRRARVSSQAWKRATREQFAQMLDQSDLGVRTKRIVELLAAELIDRGSDPEQASALAAEVFEAAGVKLAKPKKSKGGQAQPVEESSYLMFVGRRQIQRLAELALDRPEESEFKKAVKAQLKRADAIDIALFGRMVADAKDLNVDAACQVAHAISVHKASAEFDYFTAVDDVKDMTEGEDAGAGMIGTVEFNSSTLYRYATIDVDRLRDNLGDQRATVRAAIAFVRSFATSMPSGKQNTFANRTLPQLIHVSLREDQPVNLVGAYESPVPVGDGYLDGAIARLAAHRAALHASYDLAEAAAWVVAPSNVEIAGLGSSSTLAELLEGLAAALDSRGPEAA